MKLNKKGFMMAEVIVVSSIVLIFLASLYASYNQLYATYSTRVDYYDTNTLYKLAFYRDTLIDEKDFNSILENTKNNNLLDISNEITVENNHKVFLIYNNQKNIEDTILGNDIHKTFKEYLTYVSKGIDLTKTNYVMIMENCNKDNENDCKYAYLEINDGYEN